MTDLARSLNQRELKNLNEQSTSRPLTMLGRLPLKGAQFVDLISVEQGGFEGYVSTGTDPQFVLCALESEAPLTLPPGRYRFFFQARVTRGRIQQPRLYLDVGHGFSESPQHSVFLERIAPDVWAAEFFAPSHVNQIRFDPSETLVRFTLGRMEIEEWGEEESCSVTDGVYRTARALFLLSPSWLRSKGLYHKFFDAITNFLFRKQRRRLLEQQATITAAGPQFTEALPVATGRTNRNGDIHSGAYHIMMATAGGARSAQYAPISDKAVDAIEGESKILAFYLPQFHPFPENDEWWGRGFTEWTNVSKAVPQFVGHNQPRLPGELGFYDLRLPQVMARQFELARKYGIDGFCFHYYWFNGKRLLERPIEMLLADKSPAMNFPFCLCWANENWTRRWDGADSEILMEQCHTAEDHKIVFADLLRYMKDSRYLRIDGKPILVVYRPAIIPDVKEMVEIWRTEARAAGLPGLFLVASTAFGFSDAKSINFDAIVEFPPHAVSVANMNEEIQKLNDRFSGNVYDYAQTVDAYICNLEVLEADIGPYFPGVMTEWDNEARKPGRGHIFHKATPSKFHQWLSYALAWGEKHNTPSNRFVFINAWNEWAEGTYLEPDRRNGYAYLSAVASARLERRKPNAELAAICQALERRKKTSDTAVCLHLYYDDLIEEFAATLRELRQVTPVDLILSVADTIAPEILRTAVAALHPTRVIVSANRGRDVWPFIQAARVAASMGYVFGCKIHSKKSLHLNSGDSWRKNLIQSLLSPASAATFLENLTSRHDIGLAAPASAFFSIADPAAMRDNRTQTDKLIERLGATGTAMEDFAAGTMFWFRFGALKHVLASDISADDFGPELGAIDGTLAHAFERAFATLVAAAGFKIERIAIDGARSPYG